MYKARILFTSLILLASPILLSWGVTGHRTIGRIAENHLSPKAIAAVRDLLGNESLADASTWADEVRSQAEYKRTGPWHYIDLPLGLSFPELEKDVKGMTSDNVYKAINQSELTLADKSASREQKIEALKFIIHFIGDIHQPMHVSREEDKGGNTIQLNYDGQGTNLHALWDSKLLDHQGLNDGQLAEKYDHIPLEKIKEWQSAPMIQWIWESYQISSRLYAEVDGMNGRTVPAGYYEQHMPIVEERIQQAGIRLAGVLNALFDGRLVIPAAASAGAGGGPALGSAAGSAASAAGSGQATAPADSLITYCEKVYSGKYFSNSGMTLLNLGAEYPAQKMTVVIKGENRAKFKDAPETYFMGKTICVTGRTEMYKGKPEIVVTDPSQIKVQ